MPSPRRFIVWSAVAAFATGTSLLLLSCDGEPTVPSRPIPAAPAARRAAGWSGRGAHGRGPWTVPHFYFLPPLAPEIPKPQADPDATLRPDVSICELYMPGTPVARCARTVAHFSSTKGTDGQTVHYSGGSGAQYSVDWHTGASGVVVGKTYRVTVTASGAFVGSADLVAAGTGAPASATAQSRTAFLAGRSVPIAFRIEKGAVSTTGAAVVSSAGGAVASSDASAGLAVPAGAVTDGTTLTVAPATGAPPATNLVTSTTYNFGPNGAQFAVPVTVTIAYDPAKLPSGVRPQDLKLFTYDAAAARWVPVVGSQVDSLAHTVTGEVSHFCLFAAGTTPPPAGVAWLQGLSNGSVASTTITTQLGDPRLSGSTGIIGVAFAGCTDDCDAQVNDQMVRLQCDRVPEYSVSNPAIATLDSVTSVGITDYYASSVCADQGITFGAGAYPVAWVTTHALGTTYLRATVDGFTDSLTLNVVEPRAVLAGLSPLTPNGAIAGVGEPNVTSVGQSARDTAYVTTEWGAPLPARVVTWMSDDPTVTQVRPIANQVVEITGLRGGCAGVTATVDNAVAQMRVAVEPTPVEIVFAGTIGVPSYSVRLMGMTATGCDPKPLAGLEAVVPNVNRVRWSPDGTRLALQGTDSLAPGQGVLFVYDIARAAVTRIAVPEIFYHFEWSPDGRQIIGAGRPPFDQGRKLYLVTPDGSSIRQVTFGPSNQFSDNAPSWSPDGSRVAYHRYYPDNRYEIRVLNVATGVDTVLLAAPDGSLGPAFPVWSPDGSRIAYGDAVTGALRTVNSDGTGTVTIPGTVCQGPSGECYAWSPDGMRLAYIALSEDSRRWDLWVVARDGSGSQRLAENVQPGLSWSPSGHEVVVALQPSRYDVGPLYRVAGDAQGRGLRLSNESVLGLMPSWRPVP